MKKKLVISRKASVAIVYRPDTANVLNMTKTLVKWLTERGYKAFTAPEQKLISGTKAIRNKKELDKIGLIISIGGDGTYLRAVRLLSGKQIPILGVNMGSLGFLTPTRAEELFSSVEHALEGKMELRPRSMIEVTLWNKNKTSETWYALNDLVIERGSFSQLINVAVHAEKQAVNEVKADGIIISTPTGSTAYNLAAGGPILHPAVEALVVTPISPHSLTHRPLIFPDTCELSFKLLSKGSLVQKAHLVIDGVKVHELTSDEELTIVKSSQNHLMVLDPRHSYFHLLREKLKFGDRA